MKQLRCPTRTCGFEHFGLGPRKKGPSSESSVAKIEKGHLGEGSWKKDERFERGTDRRPTDRRCSRTLEVKVHPSAPPVYPITYEREGGRLEVFPPSEKFGGKSRLVQGKCCIFLLD